MREGEEPALKAAQEKDYVPAGMESLEGSDLHFNMFESMITGRNMHDENLQPNENFRKIFKAQLIKDVAMAHFTNKLISSQAASG
jgi:hypothetical protein